MEDIKIEKGNIKNIHDADLDIRNALKTYPDNVYYLFLRYEEIDEIKNGNIEAEAITMGRMNDKNFIRTFDGLFKNNPELLTLMVEVIKRQMIRDKTVFDEVMNEFIDVNRLNEMLSIKSTIDKLSGFIDFMESKKNSDIRKED